MQGFNMGRYHAPSSLDTALSTHSTSRVTNRPPPKTKTQPTAPTVRFEMPFAIWCTTCPSPSNTSLIGQGVRFNALKKRIGNYYSTPVWSFRMKHTACGGWLQINTDPKNSDFLVVEGAKKRDYGVDEAGVAVGSIGTGVGGLDEEREKKRQDAFVAFEGKAAEKVRKLDEAERVEELRVLKERDWKHVDEAGARLRAGFRVGRREMQKEGRIKEEVQERMGLGIELLDVSEADAKRAGLVDFGASTEAANSALKNRSFLKDGGKGKGARRKAEKPTDVLREELLGNTRAALDPFAGSTVLDNGVGSRTFIPGVKRKRKGSSPSTTGPVAAEPPSEAKSAISALVAYDSD